MTQLVTFTVQYQAQVELPSDVDAEEYLHNLNNQQLLDLAETKMRISIDDIEEYDSPPVLKLTGDLATAKIVLENQEA